MPEPIGMVTLSPDDFGEPLPPDDTKESEAAQPLLDAADQGTLKRALAEVRAARKVSDAASEERIALVIGYLTGFLDSRGLISESTTKPGFARLFGDTATISRDTALDELELSLESAVEAFAGTTRLPNARKVAGALLQGIGIAVGALL